MVRSALVIWLLACFVPPYSCRSTNPFRALLRRARDAQREPKDGFVKEKPVSESPSLPDDDYSPSPLISLGARGPTASCSPALWRMTIALPGCVSARRKIHSCLGTCTSIESNSQSGRYTKTCSCCKQVLYDLKEVKVKCQDPKTKFFRKRKVQIPDVTKCACRPCSR